MTSLAETARELIRTDPALAAEVARLMTRRPAGGLTARQRDAYEFICSYHAEHGITPTFSEIMDALGLQSKSGVFRLIEGLVERGYIERIPGCARSISLREIAA